MRSKSPALPAKLSPPRLVQTLPRERLFSWLDGQRERSAIWIAGAPGAGKTMLVASYCQARALRMLWYRFDADDNDIGRFFATLGQAVDALGIRARRPAFAAEHLSQPMAYARAWFRLVFAAFAAAHRPGARQPRTGRAAGLARAAGLCHRRASSRWPAAHDQPAWAPARAGRCHGLRRHRRAGTHHGEAPAWQSIRRPAPTQAVTRKTTDGLADNEIAIHSHPFPEGKGRSRQTRVG